MTLDPVSQPAAHPKPQSPAGRADVVLASGDLMVISQTSGVAQLAEIALVAACNAADLVERCRQRPGAVVVLDLGLMSLEIAAAVARLKELPEPPRRIAAFGPHVHLARLEAAAAAGCSPVLARGQFLLNAGPLLQKWTAEE